MTSSLVVTHRGNADALVISFCLNFGRILSESLDGHLAGMTLVAAVFILEWSAWLVAHVCTLVETVS